MVLFKNGVVTGVRIRSQLSLIKKTLFYIVIVVLVKNVTKYFDVDLNEFVKAKRVDIIGKFILDIELIYHLIG